MAFFVSFPSLASRCMCAIGKGKRWHNLSNSPRFKGVTGKQRAGRDNKLMIKHDGIIQRGMI